MDIKIRERIDKIEEGIVPHGYKETKIGVIPDDWEVKKLGEVSNYISSGKTKNREGLGKYVIYGSTGEIGCSSEYDYEGIKILIARVGANAGLINIVDGKYGVSDNTLVLDLKSNNIMYIYYYLKIFNLNRLVFGTGQPLITGGGVKKLDTPIPPYKNKKK